jgi:hypothetical protein
MVKVFVDNIPVLMVRWCTAIQTGALFVSWQFALNWLMISVKHKQFLSVSGKQHRILHRGYKKSNNLDCYGRLWVFIFLSIFGAFSHNIFLSFQIY